MNLKVKPHGHYRMTIIDPVLKQEGVEFEETISKTFKLDSFSIENCTDMLTSTFQFTEYVKNYAYYKDGNTEYIRFEGTVADTGLQLTIDVFSCYCEPLNENQEPPF